MARVDGGGATLAAGACLYVPPYWLHQTATVNRSVAVNVWSPSRESHAAAGALAKLRETHKALLAATSDVPTDTTDDTAAGALLLATHNRASSLAVAEQRDEVRWEPCKVHQEGVLAAESGDTSKSAKRSRRTLSATGARRPSRLRRRHYSGRSGRASVTLAASAKRRSSIMSNLAARCVTFAGSFSADPNLEAGADSDASEDDFEDREYVRGLFEAEYAEAMSYEGHD